MKRSWAGRKLWTRPSRMDKLYSNRPQVIAHVFVNLLRSFFLFRLVLKSVGLVSGCALNLPKDEETLKSVFLRTQKDQAWGETRIQTTYFLISSEPNCNIWFLFILVYLDISHADCFPFSELIVGLPMTAFCVFIVIFRPLDKCCGHKRSAKLSNWGSCEILQNILIFFFF